MDGRRFVPAYQSDSEALSRISLATFADDVEALRVELGYDRIKLRYGASTGEIILIGAVPYAFGDSPRPIQQRRYDRALLDLSILDIIVCR